MSSTLFIALLLAPGFVVWLFGVRLALRNMKLVRELVAEGVLPPDYSNVQLALGNYSGLDPRLAENSRRGNRVMLAFALAGIWALVGGAVIGYILYS